MSPQTGDKAVLPANVATLSPPNGDETFEQYQGIKANVAVVANVAKGPKRERNAEVAQDWQALFEERAAIRQFDGRYTRAEVEALAWGEIENRWHLQHGERVARDLCAGCHRSLGDAQALDLIDGCRVHDAADHACLIRHGERWRLNATRALIALGVTPPSDR
jgi:hypothetical protein